MKKSLGDKRKKLGEGPTAENPGEPDHIAELTKIYEKNGSFILPVVLEDAKEIWAKRVKELHNINLEDL